VIDELLQVWPHTTNGSSANDVVHFAGQCDGAEEICRVHFDYLCVNAWTKGIPLRNVYAVCVESYGARARKGVEWTTNEGKRW